MICLMVSKRQTVALALKHQASSSNYVYLVVLNLVVDLLV
jgi:hypothetical protein